jgi:hypothetical protein
MPNQWEPRPSQLPVWNYVIGGGKRAVLVCHRRFGKDSVSINLMATKAVQDPGLYYYMAPTQKHARKIIWDNIGSNGMRIIDQAFPAAIRQSCNDQDMRIVLKNGSIIQVVGSDNYDSLVGSNPKGLVFSEWSLADPTAWDYLRPILTENGGWALFIYTPRGLNHGYETYTMARQNVDWYCERLTVEDTGIMSPAQIQAERDAGMSETKIRQEFYCDFVADTERQLFSTASVDAASKRETPRDDIGAACIMGVDVARFGDDESVIAVRVANDMRSIPLLKFSGYDSVQLAHAVMDAASRYKADVIFVDETGIGAGVVDILKRKVPGVIGINFAQKADDPKRYTNKRAEMYDRFREWTEGDAVLPDDRDVIEEICILEYDHDVNGKLRLEKKADLKKRIGKSPDIADAMALTFARLVPRRDMSRVRGMRPEKRSRAIMR